MKSLKLLGLALALSCGVSASAFADHKVAFIARAGTRGVGGELVFPLAHNLNFRGGVYGLNFSHNDRASGIDYKMNAKLLSAGGYLDWYVGGGNFHLSAGALYDGNKVDAHNLPAQTFDIGRNTYTADEIGQLNGRIRTNNFAPYAGIGWGNALTGDHRVKFMFDLGVMYHGKPQASLVADIPADSPLNASPTLLAQFNDDLKRETTNFQNDIAGYRFYPVVSLGVSYAF
ncbi:hypothetical protein [Kordiimonas marina]|uniref:hypothetical protein n=1 Tax=Kordiimonas marina TaxID=2872312 RepID=UPI001FF3D8A8|nr:hypothetical protein [Kordiimonas marina]MCJ9429272.1 hypothetical protein [Kordiimonas marina]